MGAAWGAVAGAGVSRTISNDVAFLSAAFFTALIHTLMHAADAGGGLGTGDADVEQSSEAAAATRKRKRGSRGQTHKERNDGKRRRATSRD